MHEYSLVQSLLDRVDREACDRGATAVRRVWVRIGELSGVAPELFDTAFELFRTETICRNAELMIDSVEARWECRICRRPLARGETLSCVDCGAAARLVSGDEITLDRIELEVS
jgi:hydrogenase nickel incorporation protein HypA/HybF